MATLLAVAAACVIVSLGLISWVAKARSGVVSSRKLQRAVLGQVCVFGFVYVALLAYAVSQAWAKEPAEPAEPAPARQAPPQGGGLSVGDGIAMLGVALATGLAVLGASYAVAVVGSAALGAIAEKPQLFGRTLVFIGLAEGLAIYGLIVSILMLGRLG